MEDQNKLYFQETTEKLITTFDKVCRFCLSRTKSNLTIYNKCIIEQSKGMEGESIYNFVTKLRFIKMEDSEKFPAQICQDCNYLVQLCYLFSQICQKSDILLRDCYQNISYTKERENETECKKIMEKPQLLSCGVDIPKELNELKQSNHEPKPLHIFEMYKKRLNLLSEKLKEIQLNNPNLIVDELQQDCSYYFQKFQDTSSLNSHIDPVHCQKSVKTQYKTCKKLFMNENQLQKHFKNFHAISEPQKKDIKKGHNFCFYCTPLKKFESDHQLLEHLNVSHDLKPKFLKCLQCSDLFTTRLSLNQHLSLVHNQKVVHTQSASSDKQILKQCCPSNDLFGPCDESKFSKKGKANNKPWICLKCNASYSRKESLRHHLKEKHNQKTPGGVKCPEPDCPERFATNRRLLQHGITAHQKYFTDFHEVFKKILQPPIEDKDKEKNFECDVCQRRYIYKSSLRKHILAAHLGISYKDSVVCPYCSKTISSKLNLKSHIELVHEALFVFCPICEKKINFRTIGKHYKTHKATTDMLYFRDIFLCKLCGKILKSKRSFEDHQTLHENIKNELCDICGSGFTTKKFLRLHKRIHDGSQRRVFKCEQCGKAFNGSHSLNRHLLTHSGQKNFICEICSKCFYTISELKRHVRFHKKDYRFDCQLCDKRFFDKSPFRHHMMKHRNVRPHKCQFCEKMFIVRGKMVLHMASKHNIDATDAKKVWKDPNTYVSLDDLL